MWLCIFFIKPFLSSLLSKVNLIIISCYHDNPLKGQSPLSLFLALFCKWSFFIAPFFFFFFATTPPHKSDTASHRILLAYYFLPSFLNFIISFCPSFFPSLFFQPTQIGSLSPPSSAWSRSDSPHMLLCKGQPRNLLWWTPVVRARGCVYQTLLLLWPKGCCSVEKREHRGLLPTIPCYG